MYETTQRRKFLMTTGAACAGLLIASPALLADEGKKENEVTANEDLVREHGVIRRALLIYTAAAEMARKNPKSLPLPALGDTARLLRSFAEDYHERALEETHIFPMLGKAKGDIVKLPDILLAQHKRGREITDYVQHMAVKPSLNASNAESLAIVLENFAHMYDAHAAREDTELFPAWRSILGPKAYAEMGERFEEIEHKTFGHDGFSDALRRIRNIEAAFGLTDLNTATAPAPPRWISAEV